MYGIIETEEGHKCILILLLNFLCCFLETGQHGTLTAGQMLTGISVLTDFCKHLLHDNKLIRYEWKILREFHRTGISFNVQNRAAEAEQVAKNRIVLIINPFQNLTCRRCFFQNTFLNHFIHRGRRKAQTNFKASLNAGELIRTYFDDLINGFLSGANDPDFAATFTSDFFGQRLEVQQHIGVSTDILTNFVNHKQQTEVCGFRIHIGFHICNKLCYGKVCGRFIIKPGSCIFLAHIQNFHQSRNNELAIKSKGTAGFHPGLAFLFFKHTTKFLSLALLINITLKHSYFQIFPVVSKMGIEHFCKNTKYRRLILCDRTFNVNVKQNRFCHSFCRTVNHHKGSGIILKLFPESLHATHTFDFFVLQ